MLNHYGQPYQLTSRQEEDTRRIDFTEADALITRQVTTHARMIIPAALEISQIQRLLEIEKSLKHSLKSPFWDNAIMAAFATLSLAVSLFEITGLFNKYSLEDSVENVKLTDLQTPIGWFHESNRVALSLIMVIYSVSLLKYTIEGVPDELLGDIKDIARVDVHGWNRTRTLTLVKNLISRHEDHMKDHHSRNHSDVEMRETFFSLDNIRLKLEKKILFREKLINNTIILFRVFGFVGLATGYYDNYGTEKGVRTRALLAYLIGGICIDTAFLTRLLSFHLPNTEQILNEEELILVREVLQDGMIHKSPAEHVLHNIRRHSVQFFSPPRLPAEVIAVDEEETKTVVIHRRDTM
jgi:hypothetical protein